MAVKIQVIEHPLVATRLGVMRNQQTDNATFRQTLRELTTLLVYEATRELRTTIADIETPVTATTTVVVDDDVLFVPILRAGLGMLDSASALVPNAGIGFVGMARNEQTHEPDPYMESLPSDLSDKRVIVLDPMLATGGSLLSCLETLQNRAATSATVICVLAAPEGLHKIEQALIDLDVYTASIDEKLNENAFIVPGLGDAGDRQFGRV